MSQEDPTRAEEVVVVVWVGVGVIPMVVGQEAVAEEDPIPIIMVKTSTTKSLEIIILGITMVIEEGAEEVVGLLTTIMVQ